MAKEDRIDFRIDSAIKAQFAEAAHAFGMNLSAFMIAAAQEQVARAKHRIEPIRLNDRDRDAFLKALDSPTPATPAPFLRAKQRRGKRISSV